MVRAGGIAAARVRSKTLQPDLFVSQVKVTMKRDRRTHPYFQMC